MTTAESHPLWVCGLKSGFRRGDAQRAAVTPFMSVWIEISPAALHNLVVFVTPFMGVWIEIEKVQLRNVNR